MTIGGQTQLRDLAAYLFLREVGLIVRPSNKEGAGNAGCPMHPQPRVRFVVGVCTRVFTAEAPDTSGIPHAMVLRLIRDLPGTGLFLPPSFRKITSCKPWRQRRGVRTTRLRRPHQARPSSAPLRPPHPASSVRDVAQRPSEERDQIAIVLIWVGRKEKILETRNKVGGTQVPRRGRRAWGRYGVQYTY